jgi:hypothetical protein
MSYRLGVDVGGTFTDLLLFDEARQAMVIDKVATTVPDPAAGIAEGVERVCDRAGIHPSEIRSLLHGTTVATNAVLERKSIGSDGPAPTPTDSTGQAGRIRSLVRLKGAGGFWPPTKSACWFKASRLDESRAKTAYTRPRRAHRRVCLQ